MEKQTGIVAYYEDYGYKPWFNAIDAQVAREYPCEHCGSRNTRFVGLQQKTSRIAVQVCDDCHHEQEF